MLKLLWKSLIYLCYESTNICYNIMYVKMHMNVCKHKYMVRLLSRSYTWKRVRFTSCWIQQMNFQGSTVCWCYQKVHYFTLALAFTLQTLNAAFIFKHLHIYSVLNTFYFTVSLSLASIAACLILHLLLPWIISWYHDQGVTLAAF